MKKVILLSSLFISILISKTVQAQYCGTSGTSICTANTSFTTEGFQPPEDSLPCIVDGIAYSQVIQVHTPATVTAGGSSYTLSSIKIDTISNLPCGMCWAMGNSALTIAGNATGCLKMSGTTYDAPGQYLLHIIVNATVSLGGFPVTENNQNLSSQGLKYFVRVQLPGGPCALVDTLATGNTASHAGTLAAPTIAGNLGICSGGSTTLTASGTNIYAYEWSTGATTAAITVSSVGTYTVTAYGNCTTATATKTVSIAAVRDTITAAGPTTFCQGSSVTLSVPTGSASYIWSNGATTNSISATAAATYTVTVTNSTGCSAVSSGLTTTVNPLPANTVTAGGPLAFCPGGSVSLSGPAGLTYHWSTGATTQSITASQGGNYLLTVTNGNSCSAVSSATTVTIYALPDDTITAGGATAFCAGGSVTLSGAAGLTYLWSTGATTSGITVTQAGAYTLTVTNSNNCSAVSAATTVTVNALPGSTITAGGPLAFCAGGSVTLTGPVGLTYHWSNGNTTQSITATQAGSYTLTVTNSNNCSAVSAATAVTVYALPNDTITAGGPLAFCAGGSVTLSGAAGLTYSWSNGSTAQSISVAQGGTYKLTVTNANNCTAVSAPTTVTVNAVPDDTVTVGGPTTFCPGGSVLLTAAAGLNYSWSNGATTQSVSATQAASYVVTVTNSNHCSAVSSATLVTLNNATTINTQPLSQVTCINGAITFSVTATGDNLTYQWQKNGVNVANQQNPSYNIASAALTDTGNYRVIVAGLCGSDTSSVARLGVTSSITFSQQPVSQSACLGTSVSFSVVANGANTAFQWKKSGAVITGANSSTYIINSVSPTDTGSYTCYVTSNCGNATSNAGTLTVNSPSASGYSQAICAGSNYNFNGSILSAAGTYYDTLSNINGCDSLVTLHLSITPVTSSQSSASICQGGTFTFNGLHLTAAGIYSDTLTGSNGCDSIAYITLTVNQPSFSQLSATICSNGSYNFNGRTVTTAGTYNDTLTNHLNCDSIITLTLTVNPVLTSSYTASVCAGGTYNFNGRNLTQGGSYKDTLQTVAGCDSIVTLLLSVSPASGSTASATICAGATYSFGGNTLSATGTYYDTLSNGNGCDSIITLRLTVSAPIATTVHAAVCAGNAYSFNGQQLTTSGTYTGHFTAANGCDSTVTLILQVNSFVTSTINNSICAGSSYSFNGRNLTAAGTYYDTLTAGGGCDSIVTLNLSILQPTTGTIHAAICAGGSYSFNNHQLTTTGTYTETLTGSNGCDSVVTLTLQVNSFVTTNITSDICPGGSYNFNGRSLSVGGVYNDTLTAQGGCDSIVILTLTVNPATASSIHATICNGSSYSFNGQQLNAAGSYTETLTNSRGCDSVVTLYLQVNSFVTSSVTAHICTGETYNFNGRVLNATGTYTDTLTAQGGCDSIITLSLTLYPVVTQYIQASTCAGSSYNFNGQQVNAAGVYTDTLTGTHGCDSIVVLTLSIAPALHANVSAAICSGGSYNFNGHQISAAGSYTDTLSATGGCDSIVTLTLTIGQGFNIVLHESICEGSSYYFNNQYLALSGTYADSTSSSGGCDSVTTLFLSVIPSPTITWTQADTICDNNSLTQITLSAPAPTGGILAGTGLNGLVLTVNGSGTYPVTYTYVGGSGCSNSVTKNIVVESCLGIATVDAETAISIYPNPANDVLIAQSEGLANLRSAPMVFDITGKLMTVTFTQQADKITFNTGSLAAGVYLIKLNINGTVITKRFVKAD